MLASFLRIIYGQSLTGHIHMKYKQIILDTRKMLGFRLTDVKQSLGVATGVKVGGKPGKPQSLGITTGVKLSTKFGPKIGSKIGTKGA